MFKNKRISTETVQKYHPSVKKLNSLKIIEIKKEN